MRSTRGSGSPPRVMTRDRLNALFIDDHGSQNYCFRANRVEDNNRGHWFRQPIDNKKAGSGVIRDFETGESKRQEQESTLTANDGSVANWEFSEHPHNPKNWTNRAKWTTTSIISAFAFISPVLSSMVAPGLQAIGDELNIKSEFEKSLSLSIFVLAYAIGPLFLGPLSEIFGRVAILQLSTLFFLAFNIGCGFAQTGGQLIVSRFLSGLGGSACLSVGGGVLSDMWDEEERGVALGIYSVAPLLGPAVGPIAGGFIVENTTWRWCFWSTSIVTAGIQCLAYFCLRESYAPSIQAANTARLRNQAGHSRPSTESQVSESPMRSIITSSLIRPFRLLGTQIIIQTLALYMAYIYGLLYLVLTTFPIVWQRVYHESVSIGSLNYISLGVGFTVGSQISSRLNDKIYVMLKRRNNDIGLPEFRIPLMIPSALLTPLGLFIYGWTSYKHVHWIVPNIGSALFAAGVIMGIQCTQTYLIDAYPRFAASAIAAAVVLRSLAGFGFPLFGPYLYESLGLNWGNSLLGFIAIAAGSASPVLLWKYGQILRDRSTYAAG